MTSDGHENALCKICLDGESLPFDFTLAFQPIVDIGDRSLFAYETLVRGRDGSSAAFIMDQVTPQNRYAFDQACRLKAIEMAARLQVDCYLSINFMPNAVYEAASCIRPTLAAAKQHQFPIDRLIFEMTENERSVDQQHLKSILAEYRRQGLKSAIDDFGAGYSGLNLLAEFQPDIVKLDMALVRDIDQNHVRQVIVQGILGVCRELHIEVIAEGVESTAELRQLQSMDVHLFQGFLFARPGFESLPPIHWPDSA